jgi:hypothetical protein
MDKDALLTIGRPQRLCVNCNAPLMAIERHPSALRHSGRQKFERLDYCPECWQVIKDEAYESYWITHREVKERKAPKLNRRQRSLALRALFETLWDKREDEDLGPQLYVLSHLLMKWGGLKWRESRTDLTGRELIVFEDLGTNETLEIPSVEMDDTMLALVTGEIEEFMKQYAPEDTGEL